MYEGTDSMNISQENKTVVVTGGAQGIGRSVCACLLDQGYAVVLADCDPEALADAGAQFAHKKILLQQADVKREDDVRRLFAQVKESGCSLAGIVNNAGIMLSRPVGELTLEQWHEVLDTNLTSVFLTAKYGSPLMEYGSIVNIASTRAFMSEPDTEAYGASKGGIIALTHSLAVSLGPAVRVNAVSPGWIDVSHAKKRSAGPPEALSPEDHRQHPAGRVGRPEDVAETVLFLLSPKSGFITGENIVIDGGMTRKMIYV